MKCGGTSTGRFFYLKCRMFHDKESNEKVAPISGHLRTVSDTTRSINATMDDQLLKYVPLGSL